MAVQRYILTPILLCFQLLMVAGGPVVAQYCCGQRVALQADCSQMTCCPVTDPCCEDDPSCSDDIDLTLEFAHVGALDDAIATSHVHECAVPLATYSVVHHIGIVRVAQVRVWCVSACGTPSPPERAQLGVRQL